MWVSNGVVPAGGHGSQVAVVDERAIAGAMPVPHIETLNVTKSSKVHVGPKVVSITQNVHNKEMLKGRFLGLELVSSETSRRLRCSVAVFVCWTFLIASGLIIYFVYVLLPNQQTRQDIGLNETWYLRRDDWQAMPSYGEDFLDLPLSYVIIGHSAFEFCDQRYRCTEQVLRIQQDHMRRGFHDIGPNFLVGGNGYVFEGRGANVFGAMSKMWNRRSISIMFLGNYEVDYPDDAQFNHTSILLETLVREGVLRPEYNLYELPFPVYIWFIIKNSSRTEKLSCTAALIVLLTCISLIVYFTVNTVNNEAADRPPHEWNITRDMWLARPFNNSETTEIFSPLMLVVVQHTVSSECTRFAQCAAELRTIQSYFIDKLDYDIPYNFLIGNDGRVYEGRGWNIVGAHTFGYNRCSMGLGFIGDYRDTIAIPTRVTPLQLNRTKMLLEDGVRMKYLREDFQVVGAKDLRDTLSPGGILLEALRQWDNYDHQNRFFNLTCEEMQEKYGNISL